MLAGLLFKSPERPEKKDDVKYWYFITFTGATTSRFSCGNSENEFLPIINEYFAFPELKPV